MYDNSFRPSPRGRDTTHRNSDDGDDVGGVAEPGRVAVSASLGLKSPVAEHNVGGTLSFVSIGISSSPSSPTHAHPVFAKHSPSPSGDPLDPRMLGRAGSGDSDEPPRRRSANARTTPCAESDDVADDDHDGLHVPSKSSVSRKEVLRSPRSRSVSGRSNSRISHLPRLHLREKGKAPSRVRRKKKKTNKRESKLRSDGAERDSANTRDANRASAASASKVVGKRLSAPDSIKGLRGVEGFRKMVEDGERAGAFSRDEALRMRDWMHVTATPPRRRPVLPDMKSSSTAPLMGGSSSLVDVRVDEASSLAMPRDGAQACGDSSLAIALREKIAMRDREIQEIRQLKEDLRDQFLQMQTQVELLRREVELFRMGYAHADDVKLTVAAEYLE